MTAADLRVAALYVDATRGPYPKLPGVECFDEERDARNYSGPWPCVSHVPCGPWGQLAHLCGSDLLAQRELGPLAIEQVRRFGGVLEHPATTRLLRHCGAPHPGELPDPWGGWTLHVEQWRWGHRAIKPTFLYVVGTFEIPPIPAPVGCRPAGGGGDGKAAGSLAPVHARAAATRPAAPDPTGLRALARRAGVALP